MTDDINTFLKRIERLERGNRRLKIIVSFALCAVLAIFLIGATKWDKEIVTESLKIVDENGNIQAVLSGGPEGPRFTFYASGGKPRMNMSLEEGDPIFMLLGSEGNMMTMRLFKGEPDISFIDPNGKVSMAMRLMEGEPGIDFYDPDGQGRIVMGLVEGEPAIVFTDSNEKIRLGMGLHKNEPILFFFNLHGDIIRQLP